MAPPIAKPNCRRWKNGSGSDGSRFSSGISGELVVAEEIESRAVEIVASGARNDVHGSRFGNASRKIETDGRNLKLLHGFLREVHLRTSEAHRGDASSVNRNARTPDVAAGRAQNRHHIAVAVRGSRSLHARFELSQIEKAAPVQRKAIDLALRHDTADSVRIVVHLRRSSIHDDRLGHLANLESKVRRRSCPGFHRCPANDPLETPSFGAHFILAGQKRRKAVIPLPVGDGCPGLTRRPADCLHLSACYHGARRIMHDARNGSDRGLRQAYASQDTLGHTVRRSLSFGSSISRLLSTKSIQTGNARN